MTKIKGKTYRIRWTTTTEFRKQISRYFGIHNLTINHHSYCFITEDKEERFRDGVNKGFYRIIE